MDTQRSRRGSFKVFKDLVGGGGGCSFKRGITRREVLWGLGCLGVQGFRVQSRGV